MRTLCIDIGGTGLKAMILDEKGKPLTDRARLATPRPATPIAIVTAIKALIKSLGAFDRVSVGFPGVVKRGVVQTAPNLHPTWAQVPLERLLSHDLRKPVRVLNDAGVQGFGIIKGRGVEMVLTLGTGMGCALFMDGVYVPNLELAHHPFRRGKTYEDTLGMKGLERAGKKVWNKRLRAVIDQITPIWNPDAIYLGGGNVRKVKGTLPKHVHLADNVAGLLGGIALWKEEDAAHVKPKTVRRAKRAA